MGIHTTLEITYAIYCEMEFCDRTDLLTTDDENDEPIDHFKAEGWKIGDRVDIMLEDMATICPDCRGSFDD